MEGVRLMEGKTAFKALAAIRIVLGWGFLYAGLSKFLMIGSGEPFSAAGFLRFGTAGTWPGVAETAEGATPLVHNPTQQLWIDLAANPTLLALVDTLVVFGQVSIGMALILGLATRFAGVMGFTMMTLLTIAAWDFGHGIVNQTSLYAVVALAVGLAHAGKAYGLDGLLERATFVRERVALRSVGAVVA